MSSWYSILDTPLALVLLLAAMVLVFGQTASFLLSLREKRRGWQLAADILHLSAGFLLFVALLDAFDHVHFEEISKKWFQAGWFVYTMPWLVYAALEVLSAVILVLRFRKYRRYRRSTVTPDSIRQTMDLLPEGICISKEDGTALLVNLKMDALCRELTEERLSDARKFRAYLDEKGEDQEGKSLIHTPEGEVWLFMNDSLSADGGEFACMSAANVTARYRITEELRDKNAHLRDIQRRMKEAAVLSGEMFIKQEEANARSALHNELGQVLLMGRHYLEHPDTTDGATVALMTHEMNRFLLGENNARSTEGEDAFEEAVRLAAGIGVTVRLTGSLPEREKIRTILAQAVRECAANTVKHAEGDEMTVEVSEDAVIKIRNNGKPPKGSVLESGGLLSLRRIVEEEGGEMTVQSRPFFLLTLSFPKYGTNG